MGDTLSLAADTGRASRRRPKHLPVYVQGSHMACWRTACIGCGSRWRGRKRRRLPPPQSCSSGSCAANSTRIRASRRAPASLVVLAVDMSMRARLALAVWEVGELGSHAPSAQLRGGHDLCAPPQALSLVESMPEQARAVFRILARSQPPRLTPEDAMLSADTYEAAAAVEQGLAWLCAHRLLQPASTCAVRRPLHWPASGDVGHECLFWHPAFIRLRG